MSIGTTAVGLIHTGIYTLVSMYYERLKAKSEAERGKQRNAKDEIRSAVRKSTRARNKKYKKERDRKGLAAWHFASVQAAPRTYGTHPAGLGAGCP